MNSPSQGMQPASVNEREQPKTPRSLPCVEPLEPWECEYDETVDIPLTHPPNPVMLDGIEKKRFCPSFANRCLIFIFRADQTLTAILRRLFNCSRDSSNKLLSKKTIQ